MNKRRHPRFRNMMLWSAALRHVSAMDVRPQRIVGLADSHHGCYHTKLLLSRFPSVPQKECECSHSFCRKGDRRNEVGRISADVGFGP